jgi:ElaB/YqjD/DUF883 family membrane-anchored ribosome-binding protein
MFGRRNGNGKSAVDARLDALRSDLSSLQQDVKGFVGDVGNAAGNAANDRARAVSRHAESIAERAFRLAEDYAADLANGAEHWTHDNLESARGRVRTQPLAALALAAGVGAIMAAVFSRV